MEKVRLAVLCCAHRGLWKLQQSLCLPFGQNLMEVRSVTRQNVGCDHPIKRSYDGHNKEQLCFAAAVGQAQSQTVGIHNRPVIVKQTLTMATK